MYTDPTGHWAETDKDLSSYKQIEIAKLTIAYEAASKAGDKNLMDQIHKTADDVRTGKSVDYTYVDAKVVLNEIANLQTGYTKLDSKSATITHDYANALRNTVKTSVEYLEGVGEFRDQVNETFNNQSYIGGNTLKQTNDLVGTLDKDRAEYDAIERQNDVINFMAGTAIGLVVVEAVAAVASSTAATRLTVTVTTGANSLWNKGKNLVQKGWDWLTGKGGSVVNAEEYIVNNTEQITKDIININKNYSNGFQQNNSISNIVSSASYYENPYDQVASITRSIAQHAFENGNKRTAFDTLNMLLKDMNLRSPLNDTQKWDLISKMGEGVIKSVTDISRILQGKL